MQRHAWLWYTLIRFGILAVVYFLLLAAGLDALLAIAVAFLISTLVSFFGLGKLRGAYSAELVEVQARRAAQRTPARDEDAEAEDALLDAQQADSDSASRTPASD